MEPTTTQQTLDLVVKNLHQTSWGKARGWIETGKVFVDGVVQTDCRLLVDLSSHIELRMNAPKKPANKLQASEYELKPEQVIYLDQDIVVINKPAGISAVPFESRDPGRDLKRPPRASSSIGHRKDFRNAKSVEEVTLFDWVTTYLRSTQLEVVHRIDKGTSGLMVFARNKNAARAISNQFRFHTVHRRYLALARGRVESTTFRSTLVVDRGDGLRGSAPPHWRIAKGDGQDAVTHAVVKERFGNVATLVECQLETGRTHQIRIHLSEAGHPLLGEHLYIRNLEDFPNQKGTATEVSRVMLHAAELGLVHPSSGIPLKWTCPLPDDFQRLLAHQRTQSASG
jgi:23S rRNA pseudouridine1911/1915/1917 synthase